MRHKMDLASIHYAMMKLREWRGPLEDSRDRQSIPMWIPRRICLKRRPVRIVTRARRDGDPAQVVANFLLGVGLLGTDPPGSVDPRRVCYLPPRTSTQRQRSFRCEARDHSRLQPPGK